MMALKPSLSEEGRKTPNAGADGVPGKFTILGSAAEQLLKFSAHPVETLESRVNLVVEAVDSLFTMSYYDWCNRHLLALRSVQELVTEHNASELWDKLSKVLQDWAAVVVNHLEKVFHRGNFAAFLSESADQLINWNNRAKELGMHLTWLEAAWSDPSQSIAYLGPVTGGSYMAKVVNQIFYDAITAHEALPCMFTSACRALFTDTWWDTAENRACNREYLPCIGRFVLAMETLRPSDIRMVVESTANQSLSQKIPKIQAREPDMNYRNTLSDMTIELGLAYLRTKLDPQYDTQRITAFDNWTTELEKWLKATEQVWLKCGFDAAAVSKRVSSIAMLIISALGSEVDDLIVESMLQASVSAADFDHFIAVIRRHKSLEVIVKDKKRALLEFDKGEYPNAIIEALPLWVCLMKETGIPLFKQWQIAAIIHKAVKKYLTTVVEDKEIQSKLVKTSWEYLFESFGPEISTVLPEYLYSLSLTSQEDAKLYLKMFFEIGSDKAQTTSNNFLLRLDQHVATGFAPLFLPQDTIFKPDEVQKKCEGALIEMFREVGPISRWRVDIITKESDPHRSNNHDPIWLHQGAWRLEHDKSLGEIPPLLARFTKGPLEDDETGTTGKWHNGWTLARVSVRDKSFSCTAIQLHLISTLNAATSPMTAEELCSAVNSDPEVVRAALSDATNNGNGFLATTESGHFVLDFDRLEDNAKLNEIRLVRLDEYK